MSPTCSACWSRALALRARQPTRRTTLRVGAVTTAGEYLVAPLLRTFREAHPRARDHAARRQPQERVPAPVDHDVDLAITGRLPEELPSDGRAVRPERIRADHRARRTHWRPHARWRSKELGERPWILREPGSGTRTLCEEYLAAHGLRPSPHPRLKRRHQAGRWRSASASPCSRGSRSSSSLSSGCWPPSTSAADCPSAPGTSYTPRSVRCAARLGRSGVPRIRRRPSGAAQSRWPAPLSRGEHLGQAAPRALRRARRARAGRSPPGVEAHQADPPDRRGARTEAAADLDAVLAQHPRLHRLAVDALGHTDRGQRRQLVARVGQQLEPRAR